MGFGGLGVTVSSRKLEHGFRKMRAGIPFSIPDGGMGRYGDKDVPTFWSLLEGVRVSGLIPGPSLGVQLPQGLASPGTMR